MNQELERVKNDMATIQKAMGLSPSVGRDWVHWMKRDNWSNLWWCIPGVILIASSLLPLDQTGKYFGLALSQWTGLVVAAVMLAIAVLYLRKITGASGRPDSLIREYKRINGFTGTGLFVNVGLGVELVLYFIWAQQYHIGFHAFWSGLFIVMGSSCLLIALAAKVWLLLGWAIPFLAYGLFETLAAGRDVGALPLGIMFVAVALSFSFIQVWQIRQIESQHAAH